MLSEEIKGNVQQLIDHLKLKVLDDQFNMSKVFFNRDTEEHICKTPACIAGYADYVAKGKPDNWLETFGFDDIELEEWNSTNEDKIIESCMHERGLASKFLGLSDKVVLDEEGDAIYSLSEEMFNNNFDYNKATKQDAIKMLEHYKATGEVVWDLENSNGQ